LYDVSDRFLDVISGSHRAVVRVQVLPTATGQFPQFGANPTGGIELPLVDGDVKLTSTADVNGSVDFTISGDYWDVLQPYGAELFVERGVDFGDGTRELVPCGYYGIEEISRDNLGPVRVAAFDRGRRLQRNRVLYPIEFAAGTTHRAIFDCLVNGKLPSGESPNNYGMFLTGQVPVVFSGYDPDLAKIGSSLLCEDDSRAFLAKIADARGCVLRFARTGELLVQPRNLAPGADPVYTVKPGAGGNLVSWSQKVTRDGVYNMIVARGSDPANPTGYRLAYNVEAGSPLKWDGPFGVVTRYYASPLLLTNESADIAAETVLSRYKGLPSSLSMMAVPNPALDPLDVVQATLGATTATHLVDEVSIPLAGSQPVEIVTRTLNEVPTDEDPPSGGGGFPNPGDPGAGDPGAGDGDTAAENFNWGTPLAASDDFTSGGLNPAKWNVYSGPGHAGNGRRVPAQVAIVNGVLTITGVANGDTGGLEHLFDQQYGRWEMRVRSYRTATPPTDPGGGPGSPTQTLGVGGVATPPGAILATTDQPGVALTITSGGTSSNPKVFDGQGKKIGRVTFNGCSNVIVQNYYIQSGSQYGGVFDGASNVTLQNCDISDVRPSGDGDLNAITLWGGSNITIRYNDCSDFVGVSDPGDSHTDWLQTWVSTSHPIAAKNVVIVGNKATGPANPSRSNSIPSIHQCGMVEGANAAGSGNTGGSGNPDNWFWAENTLGDSWNQCIKLNGASNFTFTRNNFAGSSDKIFDLTSATNVKIYSDNTFGSGYGSIGATVTSGSGPATPS
jgi:hypothetical protein